MPEPKRQIEVDESAHDLLLSIWAALRGVAIGAPLDMDYAKDLAVRLEESFKLGKPDAR